MVKVKLTKGELKRQRDALKQFEHFLPVLQLKKQQLQVEIQRVHEKMVLKIQERDNLNSEITNWADLLKEPQDYISQWIKPNQVITADLNIAGVDIPVFKRVEFDEPEYDLFSTPLWIDIGIAKIRQLVIILEEEEVLSRQLEILQKELRVTTQRVNLFEKVKIPQARESIRLIRIYLGDQQTNAVGRSKIAKKKIEELVLEGVAV